MKVALLQLLPGKDLEENLAIGTAACRRAKEMGADVALFPEMWSVGYQIPEDIQVLRSMAIAPDDGFVNGFGTLAREMDMAIGITFLESWEPLPRNTLRLFDRFGNAVLTYAKVHTCDFGDERRLTPGDAFSVVELDTAAGPVKVGAMICYDREFPESARILMLQGAEIILVPNACPMEMNRLAQLRARAYENMVGIATVNYPAGQPDCNGHSSAFDGVAYALDGSGSRDTCLLEAGEAPGIYMVEFPMEMLRAYRSREVQGNAYRRPWKYGLLVSEEKNAPFLRADFRKI